MDEHGLAIDVLDLQVAQLAIPHAGGVEDHEEGAVQQVASGIDQSGDFLHGQDRGQSAWMLGIGDIGRWQVALQSLIEEKPECGDQAHHGPDRQLAIAQQVRLIASKLIQS